MIITCSSCHTRFRVPPGKIGPNGARVRCSRCRAVFVVGPEVEEPARPPDGISDAPARVVGAAEGSPRPAAVAEMGLQLDDRPAPPGDPFAAAPRPPASGLQPPGLELAGVPGESTPSAVLGPVALEPPDLERKLDVAPSTVAAGEGGAVDAASAGPPATSGGAGDGVTAAREAGPEAGPSAPPATPSPDLAGPRGPEPRRRRRAVAVDVLWLVILVAVAVVLVLLWRGDLRAWLGGARRGGKVSLLETSGVRGGPYDTVSGAPAMVVRGEVLAREAVQGPIRVRVELASRGKVVSVAETLAGGSATPEEVFRDATPDGVGALRRAIDSRAAAGLPAGAHAGFLAVFPPPIPERAAIELRASAEPVSPAGG